MTWFINKQLKGSLSLIVISAMGKKNHFMWMKGRLHREYYEVLASDSICIGKILVALPILSLHSWLPKYTQMKTSNESYKSMGSIHLMPTAVFVTLCINNVIGHSWSHRKSFAGITPAFWPCSPLPTVV